MSITFESSCPRELRAPIIHLETEAREARHRRPLDITRETAQSPARYHWRGDVNLPWYRRGWLLGQETRPFSPRQRAVSCILFLFFRCAYAVCRIQCVLAGASGGGQECLCVHPRPRRTC